MSTRNRNIFLRKETAFSCINGQGEKYPVFAHVVNKHIDDTGIVHVHYAVDYPEPSGGGCWRWHYADFEERSGTYIKPLDDFLARFTPDCMDVYASFAG